MNKTLIGDTVIVISDIFNSIYIISLQPPLIQVSLGFKLVHYLNAILIPEDIGFKAVNGWQCKIKALQVLLYSLLVVSVVWSDCLYNVHCWMAYLHVDTIMPCWNPLLTCFVVVFFQPRQNVLAAASRVGEASHDVMDGVGETTEDMDKAYQVMYKL